jgi:hypothetical protein
MQLDARLDVLEQKLATKDDVASIFLAARRHYGLAIPAAHIAKCIRAPSADHRLLRDVFAQKVAAPLNSYHRKFAAAEDSEAD